MPDVVLTEFPVGFACLMSEHSSQTLRNIEKSIKGAKHFVTYSEHIKWKTLVHEFHQDPDSITVIHHGTNTLSHLINLNGFGEQSNFAKHSMCKSFVNSALSRMAIIKNDSNVKFIFYSSQFRPNKNIINLLKAYQFLLKRKYIGIKLVLTGNIDNLADIGQFISDNNLNDDIICLYGLSEIELSSFYYLSELAVNPSLSEGGFPFTFSEALSVDTPVVMSRIPVSEEIITCPHLRQEMFFDPYDWKDMAERILWALNNKETLLGMQKTLYQKLSERTWEDCANEYIELLDKISDVNLKEIP